MNLNHTPVLVNEVLTSLSPKDGGLYVDATFGAGGYSSAVLNAAHCKVFAIDRDPTVESFYKKLKEHFKDRILLSLGKFSKIEHLLTQNGIREADGFMFDIGMSSMQIEDQNRGFSFMHDGPLDMRMGNNDSYLNAATFVNSLREEEMARVIFEYGDEKFSRRVAQAIVKAREKSLIKTTVELANIVRSVVPRSGNIDPATRTFQAIRIWVNDELNELLNGLQSAGKFLRPGGVMVAVSFHSLEDKIIKVVFKNFCDRRILPERSFSLLYKKVITPTSEEIKLNPRSRSAKLRALRCL